MGELRIIKHYVGLQDHTTEMITKLLPVIEADRSEFCGKSCHTKTCANTSVFLKFSPTMTPHLPVC